MLIKTIKTILNLSNLSFFETIKISFFAFILSILELFSIGFLAIIVSKILFSGDQILQLPFFKFTSDFSILIIITLLFISVFFKFFMTYFLNKYIFKISNHKQHKLRLRIFKLFSKLEFLKFLEKSPNLYITVVGNHIKTYGSAFSLIILFFVRIFIFFYFIIFFILYKFYYNLIFINFFFHIYFNLFESPIFKSNTSWI